MTATTKTEDCESCGKTINYDDTYSCGSCARTIGDCCGTGFLCNKCEENGGYSGDDNDDG